MPAFQDIKTCTHLAIEAMESLYYSVPACPSAKQAPFTWLTAGSGFTWLSTRRFANESVVRNQARIIWNQTVRRKMPAVWFIRLQSVENTVLLAICHLARVPLGKIVAGELDEQDFTRLTWVAAHMAAAPLKLCEAGEPGQFRKSIEVLAKEHTVAYAICDWQLLDDDLACVEQCARRSTLAVLCPG